VPIGTFADQEDMESLTFWVNAFNSISTAQVAEMADEILTALDDASLTVTSYTAMKCVREFIGAILWDEATGIFQIPMRYRVWIDKT
jgi:hypothetical protein